MTGQQRPTRAGVQFGQHVVEQVWVKVQAHSRADRHPHSGVDLGGRRIIKKKESETTEHGVIRELRRFEIGGKDGDRVAGNGETRVRSRSQVIDLLLEGYY